HKGLHLTDGHAGAAQQLQELHPAKVVFGVATVAVRGFGDGREQPFALVIAQGVLGDAHALRGLVDRHSVHSRNIGLTWSALQLLASKAWNTTPSPLEPLTPPSRPSRLAR